MDIKKDGKKEKKAFLLLVLFLLLFNLIVLSLYLAFIKPEEIKTGTFEKQKSSYDNKVYVIDNYENDSSTNDLSFISLSEVDKMNSYLIYHGNSGGGNSNGNSNTPICGNGIKEGDEECDDGDNGNDCCSNSCKDMCEDVNGEEKDDCEHGIGSPDKECKCKGFDFGIVKYECEGNIEEGSHYDDYDINFNWNKDRNECISAEWTAEPAVDGVLSKEATIIYIHSGGTSGIINKTQKYDISHITFCGNEKVEECGDGNLDAGEECDDGNNNDGDGCSSDCMNETECDDNSDCSADYYDADYCLNEDVYHDLNDFFCSTGLCEKNIFPELKQDCGEDYCTNWSNVCMGNDVWKYKICYDKGCSNGSCFNSSFINKSKVEECGEDNCDSAKFYCKNDDVWKNQTCYDKGCSQASCFSNTFVNDSFSKDCGEDYCNEWGDYYCEGKNKVRERICYDKGCSYAECYNTPDEEIESEECLYGCMDGNCTEQVCEHDVGIRYSYGNSFGTGIAIGYGNGTWIKDPVELTKGEEYLIQSCIDNKIANTTNNIHIIVKIDETILADYNHSIIKRHCPSEEVKLNISNLGLGEHNISVYVEKINETDCNLSDNYAEREITIKTEFICNKDSDCGEDGWLNEDFCKCNTNIWDFWLNYTCVNLGTTQSYCTNSTEMKLKQKCGQDSCTGWENYCKNDDVWKNKTCYDVGCALGACFNFTSTNETFVQDCGADNCNEPVLYCKDNNVWKNQTCYDKGCSSGSCFNNPFTNKSKADDCGESSYGEWNYYCIRKKVWRNKTDYEKGCKNAECYSEKDYKNEYVEECEYECVNGECEKLKCGDGNLDTGEECDDGNNINGDGCSADCKTEGCPDKDNDCVCDQYDECLNSKPGEMINEEGCDPFQFCKRFYCGDSCYKADFIPVMQNCEEIQSEQEGQYPGDCTTVIVDKEGIPKPRCTPLTCLD